MSKSNSNSNSNLNLKNKKQLGQFFTTHAILQETVKNFIKNSPKIILEPSVGRGDLVKYLQSHLDPSVSFDLYEIDQSLDFKIDLNHDKNIKITFTDFLQSNIDHKYRTIVGNPPYVIKKKRNLYLDFIEKCSLHLLEPNGGELIFIVPSDFMKLTGASKLINQMLKIGTFTDIFLPHNETLFENANIDVMIFRYERHLTSNDTNTNTNTNTNANTNANTNVNVNGKPHHLQNSNGIITFIPMISTSNYSTISPTSTSTSINQQTHKIGELFDVYVGMVSAKEDIYKNPIGNIKVLNDEERVDSYIYINAFPSGNNVIDTYLLQHKNTLIQRKIRKFNESNWFQWGAPRNIGIMENKFGNNCIYIRTLTRKKRVAFIGKVGYFGGSLLALIPKNNVIISNEKLNEIVAELNDELFKKNYMYAGRFKIGQKQMVNAMIRC